MNEWNDLFFLNEADDEDEKKKSEDKKEKDDDKKEEKKDSEKKDDKKDKDSEEEEYNDLMGDEEPSDDSTDTNDDTSDLDSEEEEEYNDLMSDDGDEVSGDDDISSDDDSDSDGGDYNTLVVVKGGDDDSPSDGGVYELAAKVAYAYVVVANNLKHIHLNASGDKFQEIHNICDDYYFHINHQADYYYELAAESPFITIDNPTRAKEHCEDISVETEKDYGFRQAVETISSNLSLLLNYLNELREGATSRPDIQSTVDNDVAYINKQVNYFLRKKLSGGGDDSPLGESYAYNDLI